MVKNTESFPPHLRLRKGFEFNRLRNCSVKIHTRHFLILLERSELAYSRLGITVSTKIDKRAVKRNRIKRLVRESFRRARTSLTECFDIVVIARKNASHCSIEEVRQELLGALMQKGFLVNESKAH